MKLPNKALSSTDKRPVLFPFGMDRTTVTHRKERLPGMDHNLVRRLLVLITMFVAYMNIAGPRRAAYA